MQKNEKKCKKKKTAGSQWVLGWVLSV